MGKEKYLKDIESLFKKSPVVTANSIARIIKNKQYAKQLVRNLILKEKVKRLAKGYYTLHDDPSLVVYCFKPSYLGLQDALSFHNLWEQETIPIIITTRKVRQGVRKVMGASVLIRRISKKYLFGFDYYEQDGLYLPYSDREKTIIDLVYFKEKIDKRMAKNVDQKKLRSYANRYPLKIKKRILSLLK